MLVMGETEYFEYNSCGNNYAFLEKLPGDKEIIVKYLLIWIANKIAELLVTVRHFVDPQKAVRNPGSWFAEVYVNSHSLLKISKHFRFSKT